MPSDNLDDLFRQQLGQHATPPGEDLQRRLAELAEAERLDALFRTGLGSHASQPHRDVWERLEDEHLRPQPRRRRGVVAWWQLSAAAVLLLALLAGGLWRGSYLSPRPGAVVTAPGARPRPGAAATAPAGNSRTMAASAAPGELAAKDKAATEVVKNLAANGLLQDAKKNRKSLAAQATAPALLPSSLPIATTTRPRRATPEHQAASSSLALTRRPDVATGQLATPGGQRTPAGQSVLPTPHLAPETPAVPQTPALVAAGPAAAMDVIEVDVRRGPDAARPAAAPVVAAAAEPSPAADQPRRRLRLGGLLRQADHLVHGEPVSLAAATGLPKTLTVQARLGGRLVSKTIQL